MTIDIQGLVMNGRESSSLIVAHGLRRVRAGSLLHPSNQRSSDLAVARSVESSPILQEHRRRAEDADNAYKTALASGSAAEQDLRQLAANKKATLDRLFHIRRRLLQAELDRLVLEDVERGKLRALVGTGPSQAIQELRDELAEDFEEEDAEWNEDDDVHAPSDTGSVAPQRNIPQLPQRLHLLLDEVRGEPDELADELGGPEQSDAEDEALEPDAEPSAVELFQYALAALAPRFHTSTCGRSATRPLFSPSAEDKFVFGL